jgi:hypothetical protein
MFSPSVEIGKQDNYYNLSDGMVDITNLKFVGVSRKRSTRFLDKYIILNII